MCLEHSDRTGRGDPAGPRGLPDLTPKARDTNQDFKQGILWLPSREWMGEGPGLLLQLQHGHLATLAPQELGHLAVLLQRDNEAASGEPGGPQGFLR